MGGAKKSSWDLQTKGILIGLENRKKIYKILHDDISFYLYYVSEISRRSDALNCIQYAWYSALLSLQAFFFFCELKQDLYDLKGTVAWDGFQA
jgi:hypothetical protein